MQKLGDVVQCEQQQTRCCPCLQQPLRSIDRHDRLSGAVLIYCPGPLLVRAKLQRHNVRSSDPIDTREPQECLIEIARVLQAPAFIAGDVNEDIPCMPSDNKLLAVAEARAPQFISGGILIGGGANFENDVSLDLSS